jgi:DNA-directed RNA polymerase subunit alpha
MDEKPQVDLKGIFTSDNLEMTTLMEASGSVYSSAKSRSELSKIISDWDEYESKFTRKTTASIKQGFAKWLLGDEDEALELLGRTKSTEEGAYLYAICLMRLQRYDEAVEVISKAAGRFPGTELSMLLAELYLETKDTSEAIKIIKKLGSKAGTNAEFHYLKGYLAEIQGEYSEAVELYEKALELEPNLSKACFRLAFNLDRMGRDEEAIKLYERILDNPPVYRNALVNVGILYEDAGEYMKALNCYKLLLQAFSEDRRLRLYYEDARASLNMVVHEDLEREQDRRNQVLKTPVSDFELSVRSRNCLNKMNIMTLGDLIRKTEAELLSYKNFGETSLAEIKEMLTAKNLRLGMEREDGDAKKPQADIPPQIFADDKEEADADASGEPISTLELSIRSRKCMDRLGINTIDELIAKPVPELLASKNFGQTSLNEIKRKLAERGMKLKEA